MFIVGNFMEAVAHILATVLRLYMWLIIIRALMSWVNPDPRNFIVQFLIRATEPVLAPIRRRLPTWGAGIDFSPMVVLLAIYFLQGLLVASLRELAWTLR
jgi:YggT family protein